MRFVLDLLFYAVVTPIAAVMRLCGFDPLRRTRGREASSAFMSRNHRYSAQDFDSS